MFNGAKNITLLKNKDDPIEIGVNFDVSTNGNLWCTHGCWEGVPSINKDGKVEVYIIVTKCTIVFDKYICHT